MSKKTSDLEAIDLERPEDIDQLNVPQLKTFLKACGIGISHGNKAALQQLARLYFGLPILRVSGSGTGTTGDASPAGAAGGSGGTLGATVSGETAAERAGESSVFDDSSLVWQELTTTSKLPIPSGFSVMEIAQYLTDIQVSLLYGEDEEVVGAGTAKPAVKGRQMYLSQHLTKVDYAASPSHLYFRGNCQASMKKLARYPGVAIKADTGNINFAQCTCVARADQRCCHVACLLYLVEDLSLKQELKISLPCTSQPQAWGKGSTRELNPTPVSAKNYSKKREQDRYLSFDPRPDNPPPPDTDRFLRNLQEQRGNAMWEKLLRYKYKDYPLSDDRKHVVRSLVDKMMAAQTSEMLEWSEFSEYFEDPLSTSSGVHALGTEDQSESQLWHSVRKMRVTGSTFKDFAGNPERMASSLWCPKKDLSRLKAIIWGTEKESEARTEYEKKTGLHVVCCGIFISKERPLFAASPDGIVKYPTGDVLIEIKCPFSLRENDLTDPKKVSSHFLDNNLCLKRSHQYFYQIQLGMYVTGCRSTHFVV